MEKYSKEWGEQLMTTRGYKTVSGMRNTWSKLIGDIMDADCSFWIFVDLDLEKKSLRLSSGPLKMLITMQVDNIQIDHPDFERFEKKLIAYIDQSIQYEFVMENLEKKKTR